MGLIPISQPLSEKTAELMSAFNVELPILFLSGQMKEVIHKAQDGSNTT